MTHSSRTVLFEASAVVLSLQPIQAGVAAASAATSGPTPTPPPAPFSFPSGLER